MSGLNEIDIQIGIPTFVVERSPNSEWKLDTVCNKNYCVLGYAISGEAFYRFGDKNYTVTKGNIVFIRQGEIYSAKSSDADPWSFYSVGFTMSANEASDAMLRHLPNVFRCSNSRKMFENFQELNRIWGMRGKGHIIKCRSLLLDILYIILGDEDRRNIHSAHYEKINEIIEYMRYNYTESYSVDSLREMSGLSSSHFRALFKQMTGFTTVQFQNRMKIEKAKDLIISHSCNITEAAETVGFSDVYYFSRMFKQLTGKNPSEYL